MRTFLEQKTRYGKLTKNSTSDNLSYGGDLINDATRQRLYAYNWYFLEKQATDSTVANQIKYLFSGFSATDVQKVMKVQVEVGDIDYDLIEVTSWDDWNMLTSVDYESDTPTFYFVYDDAVNIYPEPSTGGNTITLTYRKEVTDQSANGDETDMPFGYEMMPVYDAVSEYYLADEDKQTMSDRFKNKADILFDKMKAQYGSRDNSVRLDGGSGYFQNPNNYPQNLTN